MVPEFKMAIIGCGDSTPGKGETHSIGYAHARACNACEDTKLVAVADIVENNAADFVTEFPGTKGFTDYKLMLKDICPDIVSVCTLPQNRDDIVIAGLAAGAKAIWIEKPFALSLTAARRMLDAAKAHKARLFVNHQRRYGKPFEWLSRAAQDDSIGDVISFDIALPFPGFMDFGTHLVDAALFCLGDRCPEHVLAATDMSEPNEFNGIETETQLIATVHFTDGVRLTIEAGEKPCSKLPILRLNGTKGFAQLQISPAPNDKSIFHARFVGEANMSNPETDEDFNYSDDHALYIKRAMNDIATAIKTDTTTRIDADEAHRNIEIILAIYESARLNRMLSFPLEQDI